MPIVFYKNIGLSDADTGRMTSTVGEPSLANIGRQIFFTGNWYATKSNNGGGDWDFTSPFTTFPQADGGFCCDQTVMYEKSRDIVVWLLQYVKAGNTNTLRVAVQKDPTLDDTDWFWWDFKPSEINGDWEGEWFDYNHAALSDNYLYIGTNVFTVSDNRFTRSVIFRFPLSDLANGGVVNYRYFESDRFSLRMTQGAKKTMYFAAHNSRRQLRLFSWPETSNTVSHTDIDIEMWQGGAMVAEGPDGTNWLKRASTRITAGWVTDDKIGFAWTVNAKPDRPFPYVKTVYINESTRQLDREQDIWNGNFAFAYPNVCPNRKGDIGISMFRGGGDFNPDHVVGAQPSGSTSWSLRLSKSGTHGPLNNKWGDYVDICQYSDSGASWYASGFTLQGGNSQFDIEPRVVQFGYRRP